jgi:16S rRNA (guanine527-N7)-methyltransferase
MVLAEDLIGLDVSRETLCDLRTFAAEVRRWTAAVNLVSRDSLDDLWQRHIMDSAQVFRECPAVAKLWVDLGSGGGFPGLVVAILARELRSDLRVVLVESDQRKAVFLRQMSQKFGLHTAVLAQRIESLPPQGADVVSARALAPLDALLELAIPHLAPAGIALFPKGARHADEIARARATWTLDAELRPSLSSPDAALLIIRKAQRVQPD